MLRNLARMILLLLCCWLAAGPQMLLQAGAWGWMLVHYSQESGPVQAVQETFSGERPCAMCTFVDELEKRETKPDSPSIRTDYREIKLLPPPLRTRIFNTRQTHNLPRIEPEATSGQYTAQVPTPPPRSL